MWKENIGVCAFLIGVVGNQKHIVYVREKSCVECSVLVWWQWAGSSLIVFGDSVWGYFDGGMVCEAERAMRVSAQFAVNEEEYCIICECIFPGMNFYLYMLFWCYAAISLLYGIRWQGCMDR
jgi:hypothetical protein